MVPIERKATVSRQNGENGREWKVICNVEWKDGVAIVNGMNIRSNSSM